MFPTRYGRDAIAYYYWDGGRNPLKSGQCFLLRKTKKGEGFLAILVAIPSNRVNVSYKIKEKLSSIGKVSFSRNPLKSGQCFLHLTKSDLKFLSPTQSQSPQIGSMFPTSLSLILALPK